MCKRNDDLELLEVTRQSLDLFVFGKIDGLIDTDFNKTIAIKIT